MRGSIFISPSGYHIVKIKAEKMTNWVNKLYQLNIPYDISKTPNENSNFYQIVISASNYHKIISIYAGVLEVDSYSSVCGLPRFWNWIKHRLGIVFGSIFAMVIFVILSSVVWEVRIEGVKEYDEEFIVEKLAQLGLKEGAFIPALDLDTIVTSFLEDSATMSWMNIYRKGTVLMVNCQSMNFASPTDTENKKTAVNLVASRDAVIEELILEAGRPVVFKGTVVKKGDLLVSGVYENDIGYFFAESKGEVKGKIIDKIEVFIPFEEKLEVQEKSSIQGVTMHFFGKDISFFFNKQLSESAVADKRQIYLFDRIRLPMAITLYRKVNVSTQKIELTESEVVKISYDRLRQEINMLLAQSELVSQKMDGIFTKDGFLLKCELTYIENIAESIEISVN